MQVAFDLPVYPSVYPVAGRKLTPKVQRLPQVCDETGFPVGAHNGFRAITVRAARLDQWRAREVP